MRYLFAVIVGVLILAVAPAATAQSKWADRDCSEIVSLKKELRCWRWQARNPVLPPAPPPVVVESAPGADGAPGAKGDKGDRGAAGARGATGATGARGPAGAQGERGPAGPQGEPGADGANGVGFTSGTIVLVNGACPEGMTMQGSQNRWTVYANDTTGRPWLTSGSSAQLFMSACQVN